uniref:Boiling Stable Protein S n=1 Tax=Sesbania sesban var. bicolor TaxID=246159 RepID=Q5ZPR5_SESSE|nr:Boiling Stable Protein S [Sesbania sesban var. bicolor]
MATFLIPGLRSSHFLTLNLKNWEKGAFSTLVNFPLPTKNLLFLVWLTFWGFPLPLKGFSFWFYCGWKRGVGLVLKPRKFPQINSGFGLHMGPVMLLRLLPVYSLIAQLLIRPWIAVSGIGVVFNSSITSEVHLSLLSVFGSFHVLCSIDA